MYSRRGGGRLAASLMLLLLLGELHCLLDYDVEEQIETENVNVGKKGEKEWERGGENYGAKFNVNPSPQILERICVKINGRCLSPRPLRSCSFVLTSAEF